MKRLFFFVGLLTAGHLSAQSWLPVYPAWEHYFRHSDSALITHVLRVDSVGFAPGNDPVYFLNRVVTDCDTCSQPARLRNQGQFLQKQIRLTGNGALVFTGKTTFVLFPNASPGASWLLDTAQNLVATVTAVTAGSVLGEPDSLKIISISDGSEIVLSRAHGLVVFPDWSGGGRFELVGLPQQNLGERMPGWFDFHDFEIGDVFQRRVEFSTNPGTPEATITYSKSRVIEKFWDQDTLVYHVDERRRVILPWSNNVFYHDTVEWRIHPALGESWLSGYPGQEIPFIPAVNGDALSRISLINAGQYGESILLGELSLSFLSACGLFFNFGPEVELAPCDQCFSYWRVYSAGLGLTTYNLACFEVWQNQDLEGWVKNGDTTGIVYPDSDFISATSSPFAGFQAQVFNNPAATTWLVRFGAPLPESLNLTLITTDGRQLHRQQLEKGLTQATIGCENFPAGIYFLHLRTANGQWSQKLIKN